MRELRDLRGGAPRNLEDNREIREALLDFISDFANWDLAHANDYLRISRSLVQTAHESLGGAVGTRPLIVDPFAGGGAIPLEALRAGADAFASDLNPVAVLLNKVALEYIPSGGLALAGEVRKWAQWVNAQAREALADVFPPGISGSQPIAYLWARTILCEGPGCGMEVPLLQTFWIAKKSGRSAALVPEIGNNSNRARLRIVENPDEKNVHAATARRGSATCLKCDFTTPVKSVRRQLNDRRGGSADAS
jgi:adenine-specific DNA methylase